ncbi:hypothetical protein LCGC14_2783770 [marine sediment metagenome]|uniref:Uncharacterized protein n=1 Tax=marine sediment metagenome TaxID=412755 RepID=A0A0F8ZEQ4_9ZZZZ
MGAGKILILIGALLTLVSTFFLTFATGLSGIGFLFNIPEIISQGTTFPIWVLIIGSEMVLYILTIVYIVFILSGILQLVGLASRVVAIIGSILPIVVGVLIILISLDVLDYGQYTILFAHTDIVTDIVPLDIPLGDLGSLGAFTLLGGGVLGLVGGILGTKDY